MKYFKYLVFLLPFLASNVKGAQATQNVPSWMDLMERYNQDKEKVLRNLANNDLHYEIDSFLASNDDVDIDGASPDGNTALHHAVKKNFLSTTCKLVYSYGAGVDIKNKKGISVRDMMCEKLENTKNRVNNNIEDKESQDILLAICDCGLEIWKGRTSK